MRFTIWGGRYQSNPIIEHVPFRTASFPLHPLRWQRVNEIEKVKEGSSNTFSRDILEIEVKQI